MNTLEFDRDGWEQRFATFLHASDSYADIIHDLEHVRRVVRNAMRLWATDHGDERIVLAAAWLHDCVAVAKNSPLRSQASRMAADKAGAWLREQRYPADIAAIEHAIAAHSFTANILPTTIEAKIVQDADRLDSLGAIGTARCLMLSVELQRQLYDPAEPFPIEREPNDMTSAIDHFYTKLLKLADTMQTAAGRAEAHRRTMFMRHFLAQLASEILETDMEEHKT